MKLSVWLCMTFRDSMIDIGVWAHSKAMGVKMHVRGWLRTYICKGEKYALNENGNGNGYEGKCV